MQRVHQQNSQLSVRHAESVIMLGVGVEGEVPPHLMSDYVLVTSASAACGATCTHFVLAGYEVHCEGTSATQARDSGSSPGQRFERRVVSSFFPSTCASWLPMTWFELKSKSPQCVCRTYAYMGIRSTGSMMYYKW
jgi:hypothetical protein